MSELIAQRHTWVKGGAVRHRDLVHIWSSVPTGLHPFLISVLEKFCIFALSLARIIAIYIYIFFCKSRFLTKLSV
jgi:hypothetical protein